MPTAAGSASADAEAGGPTRAPRLGATRSIVGALALGALVCSVAFDLQAQRDVDQFIYAEGGVALVRLGVVMGILGSVLEAAEASREGRGSVRRRRRVQRLVILDLVLAWFVVVLVLRADDPLLVPATWVLAGSAVAALTACWTWWRSEVDAIGRSDDSG